MEQETEVVRQTFDVTYQRKKDWHYLIYSNEDSEKVILKFNETELMMTRFSQPRSVMRFIASEEATAVLPTPLGAQHFVIQTQGYHCDLSHQRLALQYKLAPLNSAHSLADYKMAISWK